MPLLTCLLLCLPLGWSRTLFVEAGPACPGSGTPTDPYCRIQDAIDAAVSGDSIRVRPGTYFEQIDFSGKDVVITAELGPGATTLDAQLQGTVVQFHNGESPGAVLQGFTIRGGRSGDGGGVSILGASPVIRGNRIIENTARSDRGGGLYCRDSKALIEDNTFERNTAGDRTSGFGAAIACESSEALIRGNRIRDNHAVGFSGFGAGIACFGSPGPVIEENLITANVAAGHGGLGGGLYCSGNGAPTIRSNTITDNVCLGDGPTSAFARGGALYVRGPGAPRLESNVIHDNSVSATGQDVFAEGGAIYLDGSSPHLLNNTFSGNRATGIATATARVAGGSLFGRGGAAIRLAGNVHDGNVAEGKGVTGTVGNGGAIAVEDGTLRLANETIFGNRAAISGGALWTAADTEVASAILWANLPDQAITTAGSLTISFSDVQGGFPGTGNISSDPLLRDAPAGDFRLQCASPCVDSGFETPNGILPERDHSGLDDRIIGVIDIGADELGVDWSTTGAPRRGGPPVAFEATAPPSLSGSLEVFVSQGNGRPGAGLRIPASSGRRLALSADAMLNIWLGLPTPMRRVTPAGCPGARGQAIALPTSFPVGLEIHYAGLAWNAATGKVCSVSETRSLVTE